MQFFSSSFIARRPSIPRLRSITLRRVFQRAPAPYSSPFTRRTFHSSSTRRSGRQHHGIKNSVFSNGHAPNILLPPSQEQHDPAKWIDALSSLLPFQRQEAELDDVLGTSKFFGSSIWGNDWACARDICSLMTEARHKGHDLLSILGIEQGRWDDVSCIIRLLSEWKWPTNPVEEYLKSKKLLPESDSNAKSMQERTLEPIWLDVQGSQPQSGIDQIMKTQERSAENRSLHFNALGQVWRSLGNMILEASTSSEEESNSILDQVLVMLAVLHHNGVMPERLYRNESTMDGLALRSSEFLEQLSEAILSSIADAEFGEPQEALAGYAYFNSQAQSRPSGYEFPTQRNNQQALRYVHELWLELILHAALQGGWIADGLSVLERAIDMEGENSWAAVSMARILTPSSDGVRRLPPRFISEETVNAYGDAIGNGLLYRGELTEERILRSVLKLNHFIRQSQVPALSPSWNAIAVGLMNDNRFLDIPKADSAVALAHLLESLSDNEKGNTKVTSNDDDIKEPNYSKERSMATIGVLNWLLNRQLDSGYIEGAVSTFQRIFQLGKTYFTPEVPAVVDVEDATNAIGAVGVEDDQDTAKTERSSLNQNSIWSLIQPRILSKLVDLIVETEHFDVAGGSTPSPLSQLPSMIPTALFHNALVAPSLIRYAVRSSNQALLKSLLEATAVRSRNLNIPPEIVAALIQTQVQHGQWKAVARGLEMLRRSFEGIRHQPAVTACLGREIIKLQSAFRHSQSEQEEEMATKHQSNLDNAIRLFRDATVVDQSASPIKMRTLANIHSIVGVLSSVDKSMASICQPLVRYRGRILKMSTELFNLILEGVAEGHNISAAIAFYRRWCIDPKDMPQTHGPPSLDSTGLLSRVRDYNPGRRVEVEFPDGQFVDWLKKYLMALCMFIR